jgi:hypothetical protein
MTKVTFGLLFFSLAFAGACTAQQRNDRSDQAPGSAPSSLQNDASTSTGGRMDTDPTTVQRRDSKDSKDAPAGPHQGERGNTPPGMDRAGGGPASGTIVDPANVTRQPKP